MSSVGRFSAPLTKRSLFLTTGVVLAGVMTSAFAGGKFPWPRRIGRNVDSLHITAHKNTPIALWPEEPPAPSPVNETRFFEALGELCREATPDRKERYSQAILTEAKRFDVEPFLLAALMYDQSRCWPHTPKREDPAEPLAPVLVNPYRDPKKKGARPRPATASERP